MVEPIAAAQNRISLQLLVTYPSHNLPASLIEYQNRQLDEKGQPEANVATEKISIN